MRLNHLALGDVVTLPNSTGMYLVTARGSDYVEGTTERFLELFNLDTCKSTRHDEDEGFSKKINPTDILWLPIIIHLVKANREQAEEIKTIKDELKTIKSNIRSMIDDMKHIDYRIGMEH